MLNSLSLATEGMIEQGGRNSLTLATEAHLQTDMLVKIVDRTDAHSTQGKSVKQFIREHVQGETYNNIQDAINALERAKQNPTKRKIRDAKRAVKRAVGADFDPPEGEISQASTKALEAAEKPLITGFSRSSNQLELLIEAFDAFKRQRAKEEEAIIQLLITI